MTRDDLGADVDLPRPPRRIVSLVPSLTEVIAGLDRSLIVACTDWCTHPPDLDVERVRGTKNPDVRRIVELAPDLVVCNREENRKLDVERLRAAGVAVWVTEINDVPSALRSMRRLITSGLGHDVPAWLGECEQHWSSPPSAATRRVAIPIWRDPWMVVGRDTFTGDLVTRLGMHNVFADAAGRYPNTTVAEIEARRPDVVLLPDEPFAFSADDGPEAFTVPTELINGRLLTWYGPSLLDAAGLSVGGSVGGSVDGGHEHP